MFQFLAVLGGDLIIPHLLFYSFFCACACGLGFYLFIRRLYDIHDNYVIVLR